MVANSLFFKVVALLCLFYENKLSTNEVTRAHFDILFIIGTVVYIYVTKKTWFI